MVSIDINCDMGEGFGVYKIGEDEEIIKYVTSANIACGFHAGDPTWMKNSVLLAEKNNVSIGAHPGYPDLIGFGRRNMQIPLGQIVNDVTYQIGALTAFTSAKKLQHIKPHGAMYNQAVLDDEQAKSICQAILDSQSDAILLALSGSKWIDIAYSMGLSVAKEVFADRALNPDGTLVSRSLKGSVISNISEVIDRSLMIIKEGKVECIDGTLLPLEADSICVHSDTPGASDIAKALNEAFISEGISVKSISEII
ncbi:MAG: LamB/YcsF family protein [Dehalococcoidia bacterium]